MTWARTHWPTDAGAFQLRSLISLADTRIEVCSCEGFRMPAARGVAMFPGKSGRDSGHRISVAIDRAARLAAIPAGESPANRGVQSLL